MSAARSFVDSVLAAPAPEPVAVEWRCCRCGGSGLALERPTECGRCGPQAFRRAGGVEVSDPNRAPRRKAVRHG